jgi:hypothetical protein
VCHGARFCIRECNGGPRCREAAASLWKRPVRRVHTRSEFAREHRTVNGRGGRPTAGVRDRLDGIRDAAPDRVRNQGESEGQKDGVG